MGRAGGLVLPLVNVIEPSVRLAQQVGLWAGRVISSLIYRSRQNQIGQSVVLLEKAFAYYVLRGWARRQAQSAGGFSLKMD